MRRPAPQTTPVNHQAEIQQSIIRTADFSKLSKTKRRVFEGSSFLENPENQLSLAQSNLIALAQSNRLDLHYYSFSEPAQSMSVGAINEEFIGAIAEILKHWRFSVLLFDGQFCSYYKWPKNSIPPNDVLLSMKSKQTSHPVFLLSLWT